MDHGISSARGFWAIAWGFALALMLAVLLEAGCSSSSGPSSSCSAANCPSGSACIDDHTGKGQRCLKLCTKQADCPYGWNCNDEATSWCVPSTSNVLTKGPGQWGASCLPSGGEMNSMCDTARGFGCYGLNPTDANAFCTFLDCNDSDCPGDWWCPLVDSTPNISTAKRTFGAQPRYVCKPRLYCASCKKDHDCSSDGVTQQHCVQDMQGSSFCSPQCATDAQCPLDARCQAFPWGICAQQPCTSAGGCPANVAPDVCSGTTCRAPCQKDADCPKANGVAQSCVSGVCSTPACVTDDDCAPPPGGFPQHCSGGKCTPECTSAGDCEADQTCVPYSVCMPRAGTCKGDGSFCSPCLSDYDCTNGYCLYATDSTERFCSQAMASGTTCASGAPPPKGSCPAPPSGAPAKAVGCTPPPVTDFAPLNQCFAAVTLAGQNVPGCWTNNR